MRGYITISRVLYSVTYISLLISRVPSPVTIYITSKEIAILIFINIIKPFINYLFISLIIYKNINFLEIL
jgi:hypothetical protein